MALYAKVVFAVNGKGGETGTGLQDTLGKGDTGRNAGTEHLLHGNIGISFNVFLLGLTRPLGLCGNGDA